MAAGREEEKHAWDAAGWVGRVSYWFVMPLLRKGAASPLTISDVPGLAKHDEIPLLVSRVEKAWAAEKRCRALPSLAMALMRCFWPEFVVSASWTAMEYGAVLGQAAALGPFVRWIQSEGPREEGVYFGALLVGLSLTQMVSHHAAFYVTYRGGLNCRMSTTVLLHRKLLRLAQREVGDLGAGKIYTLVANDAQRFDELLKFIHAPWLGFLAFAAVFAMLAARVGSAAAAAGCGVVFFSILLQMKLSFGFKRLRQLGATASDARVRLAAEVFTGVLAVKAARWEAPLALEVGKRRLKEASAILRSQKLKAINSTFYFATTTLASLATFLVFVFLEPRRHLDLADAATVVAALSVLRLVVGKNLARFTSFCPELLVALDRMRHFLLCAEVKPVINDIDSSTNVLIDVRDAAFRYPLSEKKSEESTSHPEEAAPVLSSHRDDVEQGENSQRLETRDKDDDGKEKKAQIGVDEDAKESSTSSNVSGLSFEVCGGEVVFVTGPVGSGKSCVLAGLLDEADLVTGTAARRRAAEVAYAPQQAVVFATTLKDNVIFGSLKKFDPELYARAIDLADLGQDIAALSKGDETQIGERGVNLSGGQKSRVCFARAAYAALVADKAPIILLDDLFAAVDAKVAAKLASSLRALAQLRKAAIVVATHQTNLAAVAADYVLTLDADGRALTFAKVTPTTLTTTTTKEIVPFVEEDEDDAPNNDSGAAETDLSAAAAPPPKGAATKDLVLAEDRTLGKVRWSTWKSYAVAGGVLRASLTALLFLGAQLAGMAADAYVLEWAGAQRQRRSRHAIIYSCLAAATVSFALVASLSFFKTTSTASTKLHDGAFERVLRAPLSFFGANPIGRIINRFSTDIANVDEQLAIALFDFVQIALLMTSAVVLAVVAVPFVALALPFLAYGFVSVKGFVQKSMNELKRLDAISKSPVLGRYSGTLSGLAVTRAFAGAAETADDDMLALLRVNARCWYWWMICNRFLGTMLDLACTTLLALLCGLAVVLRDSTNPELLALALVYGVQLSGNFQYAVRQKSLTDTFMTSVERLLHYRDRLPVEEEEEEEEEGGGQKELQTKVPWPLEGKVVFENVSCRYREDLPVILFEVSLAFPAQKKSGLCGRTGSGKSSTLLGLLRLNVVCGGRILVDGVDVSTLRLNTLRNAIAVIPQEPTLFSGSVRSNLDPFLKESQESCLAALTSARLATVEDPSEFLARSVAEGGANFSIGEKQLLCLARALLLQRRIVCIDEATANVDFDTDAHIQQTLNDSFDKTTVIVVAHRIRTILDADHVVVLEKGRVLEAGAPEVLAAKTGGAFANMMAASSITTDKTGKDIDGSD